MNIEDELNTQLNEVCSQSEMAIRQIILSISQGNNNQARGLFQTVFFPLHRQMKELSDELQIIEAKQQEEV